MFLLRSRSHSVFQCSAKGWEWAEFSLSSPFYLDRVGAARPVLVDWWAYGMASQTHHGSLCCLPWPDL